jgi:hypothetical protein
VSRILQPDWRLQNLYWFKPKTGGWKTFRPRPEQQSMYDRLYPALSAKRRHFEIKLKSRKRGTTTGCCFFCLDNTAYRKNIEAVTMAHEQKKATEIFNNIVRPAWKRIDPRLKPRERYNNKSEIDLMDSIHSKYVVSCDLKGTSPDILHLTEAAYHDHDETIQESINALPPHGICIAESTAHGVGNWFEYTFMDAWLAQQEGRDSQWFATFDPWFEDPANVVPSVEGLTLRYEAEARELQQTYGLIDEQIFWWDRAKQINRDLVYQFFPSEPEEAFIHSGRPVFDQVNLKILRDKFARPPTSIEDDIELFVEEIDTDKHYGIGVDTAEGLEHGDNASITVQCKETNEEIAQCTGKFSPHELSRKLGIVARIFPNHLAVIERNNHGHTVIAYAKEDRAINLYQREEKDKITDKVTLVIGWDTNERSKGYAINTLSRDLEDGQCIPHSFETYDELRTYVHGERGIMAAMPGKKDDRVISQALANLACREMVAIGSLDPSSYGFY